MDIIERIWDEEELDLLFIQEEQSKMNIRQIARDFARRTVAEYELMEEGLAVLIAVDDLIHTEDHPFCGDDECPCRNEAAFEQLIKRPMLDGLMTSYEGVNLYWSENI